MKSYKLKALRCHALLRERRLEQSAILNVVVIFFAAFYRLALGADKLDDRIRFPGLPLAVYREIAAHLCQVDGIAVELIPQQSQQFDYRLSQIDSLLVKHTADATMASNEQVQQILAYYSDRYSAWEAVNSDNTWV